MCCLFERLDWLHNLLLGQIHIQIAGRVTILYKISCHSIVGEGMVRDFLELCHTR